ncbi:MAG: alkaline phosphatase family protein [Verrucomicrobiales bacterium]|nr:alkaline phosphatase family protein [Verrucomicrobiales bacterium]
MNTSDRQPLFRVLTTVLTSLLLLSVGSTVSAADALKTKNVVLVTTDGLRWEEVFRGAEEILISKEYGNVSDTNALRKKFWRETPEERRKALFPFLWSTVAAKGQLWGHRDLGSEVRVGNGFNFSYPGYNEFLTGIADPRIDSNDKKLNANTNVFEWLQRRPGFEGRIAAAVNWDVLPWILNGPRAGFPIWSGFDVPEGTRRLPVPELLSDLVEHGRTIWSGVLLDTFVAAAAREALTTIKPRALYVSFGETDDWAHEARYERHLWAAHEFDRFLARLWASLEADPTYRGSTALLITVDHGRGPAPVAWKDHGRQIADSAYIWFAALGPDIAPLGERRNVPMVRQGQIAATVAALIGENFPAASPAAAPAVQGLIAP